MENGGVIEDGKIY